MNRAVLSLVIIVLMVASFFLGRRSTVWQDEGRTVKPQKVEVKETYSYKKNKRYHEIVKRHEAYNRTSKVVMLGTSLTEIVRWDELLNNCEIANRGIGGDVSEGLLNRLHTVIKMKPRVCFVEVGVNDINRDVSYNDYISNVASIVDTLKSNDIDVVLFNMLHAATMAHNVQEYNARVDTFNIGIDSVCTQKQVTRFDLNSLLCSDGYLKPEYAKKDGLHLKFEAYQIWGSAVKGYLNENYSGL